MTKAKLIKALQNLKVQTGSLTCHGCGHEHNCSTKGCTIIREAIKELEELETPRPKIGDSVYFVLLDDTGWRISEEKVVEVGKNGFFLSQISDDTEPDEYILYTYLGECYFFTKREAEEAKKAKEQEKICCNCKYYDLLPFCGQCNCPQSEFYLQHIPVDICCEHFKGGTENA